MGVEGGSRMRLERLYARAVTRPGETSWRSRHVSGAQALELVALMRPLTLVGLVAVAKCHQGLTISAQKKQRHHRSQRMRPPDVERGAMASTLKRPRSETSGTPRTGAGATGRRQTAATRLPANWCRWRTDQQMITLKLSPISVAAASQSSPPSRMGAISCSACRNTWATAGAAIGRRGVELALVVGARRRIQTPPTPSSGCSFFGLQTATRLTDCPFIFRHSQQLPFCRNDDTAVYSSKAAARRAQRNHGSAGTARFSLIFMPHLLLLSSIIGVATGLLGSFRCQGMSCSEIFCSQTSRFRQRIAIHWR